MENNKPSNNFDFDISLIADFFKSLDRQGPGSREQTLNALRLIGDELPIKAQIADIGCGTGGQTLTMAEAVTEGSITAVDLLPQMIEGLTARIKAAGMQQRITPMKASMEALPFDEEQFDLFWAEGSIYHMGYEKGLREWRKFIKTGGYIALTECSWLSAARPRDKSWIEENFVEIDSIANKIAILERCGYRPMAHFILPDSCWTENYYIPIQQRIEPFLNEHSGNASADLFVQILREEIEHYRTQGRYYGYVFYIGRKE